MGQLAMSEESNMGFMLMMAKSTLDTGRVDSLPEIFTEINAVTSQQLQDIANEMFDENQWSSLTFMPEENQ
jgi:predicted Zn-dependent peptidase